MASPSTNGSTYADPQSLQLYMYNRPREAKKLYFDVIPRAVDEYQSFLDAYPRQDVKQRLTNPVWHIHGGNPPQPEVLVADASGRNQAVSFALLLNLVAVANAETKAVLWAFLRRYAPHVSPETHPRLDALGRLCDPLLPRFREAQQALSSADGG